MPVDVPDWTSASVTPQRNLAGSPFTAAVSVTTTVRFSIDSSVAVVALLFSAPGVLNPVTVTGVTTGTLYLNANPSRQRTFLLVPVISAVDTQIDVAATNTSAVTTSSVWVVAIPSGEFTSRPPSPSPWQAANQTPVSFLIQALAAGASSVVIPGIANQTIRLFAINQRSFVGTASCFGQWESTDGLFAIDQEDLSTAWGPVPTQFFSSPLPVGTGLQFHNTSAVAMAATADLEGSVAFSQT